MKNPGLMIAGALVLAALYVFSDEDAPFTQLFALDTLPRVLKEKIELRSDGILITVSSISKDSNFIQGKLTDKEFGAIILNKMRGEFGLREKFEDDEAV